MNKAFFTSANKGYSSRVFGLVTSLKNHMPEIPFFLFTYDDFDYSTYAQSNLELIDGIFNVRDLVPMFKTNWFDQFSLIEQHCVQKPFVFEILHQMGYTEIIYLDPDIFIYDSLDSIFHDLQNYDIVLTPHIPQPVENEESLWYSELSALKHGVYNLGFIAVNMQKPNAQNFVNWWKKRCTNFCKTDFANGLFTDQKLIDLAPGLFDSIKILRNPGYNVASWNLHSNIPIQRIESILYCNNYKLVFFHFSGISNGSLDYIVENYFGQEVELKAIVQDYRILLESFSPSSSISFNDIDSQNMVEFISFYKKINLAFFTSVLLKFLNKIL